MSEVTEVAPDVFRISEYLEPFNLQFNQYLIRDDEPLLFHTGLRQRFPVVFEAVAQLIDPAELRWIGFSHFEADECGALGDWQERAPRAQAVCSLVGKMVSVDDVYPGRPARGMNDDEVLSTGRHRFRFLQTPHVPHSWEAGMMFEETSGTLLCSDLFTHPGEVDPTTTSDIAGRSREALIADQQGPFAHAYPYSARTDATLERLAALRPKTLAVMHGSTYEGDGARALNDLRTVLREVLGPGG